MVEELDGRELEERVAGWEGSWEVPERMRSWKASKAVYAEEQ